MSSNEENNVGGQLQGNQEGHELEHMQIMAKIPEVMDRGNRKHNFPLIPVILQKNIYFVTICGWVSELVDQFWIPLDVQLTDATASRGLAPKPAKSGWYPQHLPLWIDGISIGKGYPIV